MFKISGEKIIKIAQFFMGENFEKLAKLADFELFLRITSFICIESIWKYLHRFSLNFSFPELVSRSFAARPRASCRFAAARPQGGAARVACGRPGNVWQFEHRFGFAYSTKHEVLWTYRTRSMINKIFYRKSSVLIMICQCARQLYFPSHTKFRHKKHYWLLTT